MKTRLLVIVTLLIAAFVAWHYLLRKPGAGNSLEKLVPSTSVGVLSIDNFRESYSRYAEFDWWDELRQLPLFDRGQNVLNMLDTLNITTDLSGLSIHVSFHITANDQLQPLYFIQSSGFDWSATSIESILGDIYGRDNVQIAQRNYLNKVLYDVSLSAGALSFFIQGQWMALSSNALLVEDVIRAREQGSSLLAGLDYKIDTKSAVSLLVDCGKLDDLGTVFSTGTSDLPTADGLFVQLDIEATEKGIQFSGRSIVNDSGTLNGEADLGLKNFIPTTASSMQWVGLTPMTEGTVQGVDLERYYNTHEGDLCLVKLDLNNESADLVAMASLKDEELSKALLNQLATSLMDEGDTLFKESFMQTDITFIRKPQLPQSLYGKHFNGFDQTYYTVFNNVLMFGNSIEGIKTVLSEYDAENTWGRSIERRRYVDNLVQEAGITTIYNFEFLLETINNNLKESWKAFFEKKSNLGNTLDLLSFQLSQAGNGLLINAALDFNESVARSVGEGPVAESTDEALPEAKLNVFADTSLTTPVYVVRNHNDGSREMVIQDISGQLYLVSDQGVVQWKKGIGAQINGHIRQIDYYNNRKLQYLFFTDSLMHLVDRNGEDVEGFPRSLDTELPLNGPGVIDYDNTKRYRYVGVDRRGNVYLYGKEGALLEGWNPRSVGSQLLSLPEHIRVRGRDCFVMVEAEGVVHVTNRRGQYYPGFPYQTGKRLSGDVVIAKGADFSKTSIMVASSNGELIGLNLEGNVLSRNQLLRPSTRSSFEMVKDRLNTSFALVRRDPRQLVFFDQSGKDLFTVAANNNDRFEFSFYNFRNDSELFVVRNVTTQEVEVYNKDGRSLLSKPLASSETIGIIYYQSRAEYELFVNFANQMTVYTVRK